MACLPLWSLQDGAELAAFVEANADVVSAWPDGSKVSNVLSYIPLFCFPFDPCLLVLAGVIGMQSSAASPQHGPFRGRVSVANVDHHNEQVDDFHSF